MIAYPQEFIKCFIDCFNSHFLNDCKTFNSLNLLSSTTIKDCAIRSQQRKKLKHCRKK